MYKKGTKTNPDELYALFNREPGASEKAIDYEALARKVLRDPEFHKAFAKASKKYQKKSHDRLVIDRVKGVSTWDKLFGRVQ